MVLGRQPESEVTAQAARIPASMQPGEPIWSTSHAGRREQARHSGVRRHFKRTQQSLAEFLLERKHPAQPASPSAGKHTTPVSSAVGNSLPDVSETKPLLAEVRLARSHVHFVLISHRGKHFT
jgi:hypothetical protein